MLALSSILFYLKLSQKFIGEICNLAGGMTCMESGVIAINCKELIKNAKRGLIDFIFIRPPKVKASQSKR